MSNSNNDLSIGIIAQEVYDVMPCYVTATSDPTTMTSLYTTITGSTIPTSYTINSSGNLGIGTANLGSLNTASWTWSEPNPFENIFPDWNDFQLMCKEYPSLEKTFNHLKDVYNICKDDWEVKKKGNL
jgi:hypothetical protein